MSSTPKKKRCFQTGQKSDLIARVEKAVTGVASMGNILVIVGNPLKFWENLRDLGYPNILGNRHN